MPIYSMSIGIKKGRDLRHSYRQYEARSAFEALKHGILNCSLLAHLNKDELAEFIEKEVVLHNAGDSMKGAWPWNPMSQSGIGEQVEGGLIVQTEAAGPYVKD